MYESAASGLFWFVVIIACGIWGVRRLFGQFDNNGEIKGAAQKGIISMIGRWLK